MDSQKHTILFYLLTTIFISILSINAVNSQEHSASSKYFDTTGLVIRICIGDLPGQKKELGGHSFPVVCAYTYNNSKLNTYKVDGFDLVYKNAENGLVEIVPGKDDRLSTEMKRLINTSDSSTFKNFFIDNVNLRNKKGENMLVTGLRPFWPTR
jgi:hypothetical protein